MRVDKGPTAIEQVAGRGGSRHSRLSGWCSPRPPGCIDLVEVQHVHVQDLSHRADDLEVPRTSITLQVELNIISVYKI